MVKTYRKGERGIPLLFVMCLIVTCFIAESMLVEPVFAVPQGTSFSYQGKINDQGIPANGLYDFDFRLYDGSNPGTAILLGSVPMLGVAVVNGLFTVNLEFGGLFDGNERWLEIAVAPATFPLVDLSPLQLLTSVPYAVGALLVDDADADPTNE